jgi:protocatechuate 3,4-dioxygenase beta subunit
VASTNAFKLLQGANRAIFLTKLRWAGAIMIIAAACSALTLGFAAMAAPPARLPGGPPATRQVQVPSAKKSADPGSTTSTAPITVSGRATDDTGKSVSGATIYLVSTNGTDALLGKATTAPNGTFTFRDARLPVSRQKDRDALGGTFQVYGTAPGFGFAWHGMRFYMPQLRPADWNVAGEDHHLFQGEPLVMDLQFTPAATISGRVANETGRPVRDAAIRIVSCDYLDTEHKESHHNFREFSAIQSAPEALTTATTGPDGRFRLEGLPKEVGFWVRVEHPDYAKLHLHAATTARPITAFDYPLGRIVGRDRPPVETGALNVTVRSTSRIDVRTVFARTGKPAPRIRVLAFQGNSANGYSASGITDERGKLTLRLPPGDFDMEADPTSIDTNCIRTRSKFKAAGLLAEQYLELRVDAGCVVILEAVDAKSGAGIPGLTFDCERDDKKGSRWQVQSNTWYIDNPTTDSGGRLRAVVAPGAGVFTLGPVPESTGYVHSHEQKRIKLIAGETVTIRFELDK